jgi:hypothetical protein
MDPPPISPERRPEMAREALIAIGVALLIFGTYKLLDFLGMVLVGGP